MTNPIRALFSYVNDGYNGYNIIFETVEYNQNKSCYRIKIVKIKKHLTIQEITEKIISMRENLYRIGVPTIWCDYNSSNWKFYSCVGTNRYRLRSIYYHI